MDDKNPNLRNNPHDPKDLNPSSKVIGIIALVILALIVLFFVFRTPAITNPNSTLQEPAPNQTLQKTNPSETTNNPKTTTPL